MSKSKNFMSQEQIDIEKDKKNERQRMKISHIFEECGEKTEFLLDVFDYLENTVGGFEKELLLEDFHSEDVLLEDIRSMCKKNHKKANAKPKWKPMTTKKKHAYNYFVIEQNKKYKAEESSKNMTFKERCEKTKQLWNETKANPKLYKVYVDLAQQDKERYEREVAAEREQAIAEGLLPPDEDVNKPKRSLNAYFFWLKDHRSSVATETKLKGVELNKELGARWRQMSDSDKSVWLEKAANDKERFRLEMIAYTNKLALEGASDDDVVIEQEPVPKPQVVPDPVVEELTQIVEPEPDLKLNKKRKRRVRKRRANQMVANAP